MKKFSDFRVGDAFYSTCSISDKELEEYLKFSRVKNAFLEDKRKGEQQLVSGRASRVQPSPSVSSTVASVSKGNAETIAGTPRSTNWSPIRMVLP